MICTHPDIAYSVGVLSRHITCPEKTHMQAIKHIFAITSLDFKEMAQLPYLSRYSLILTGQKIG